MDYYERQATLKRMKTEERDSPNQELRDAIKEEEYRIAKDDERRLLERKSKHREAVKEKKEADELEAKEKAALEAKAKAAKEAAARLAEEQRKAEKEAREKSKAQNLKKRAEREAEREKLKAEKEKRRSELQAAREKELADAKAEGREPRPLGDMEEPEDVTAAPGTGIARPYKIPELPSVGNEGFVDAELVDEFGSVPISLNSYRRAAERAAESLRKSSLQILGDVNIPEGGFASPEKVKNVDVEVLKVARKLFLGTARLEEKKDDADNLEEEELAQREKEEAVKKKAAELALNPMCLEMYLSDADFKAYFDGMEKEDFYLQRQWKQRQMKRDVGIF